MSHSSDSSYDHRNSGDARRRRCSHDWTAREERKRTSRYEAISSYDHPSHRTVAHSTKSHHHHDTDDDRDLKSRGLSPAAYASSKGHRERFSRPSGQRGTKDLSRHPSTERRDSPDDVRSSATETYKDSTRSQRHAGAPRRSKVSRHAEHHKIHDTSVSRENHESRHSSRRFDSLEPAASTKRRKIQGRRHPGPSPVGRRSSHREEERKPGDSSPFVTKKDRSGRHGAYPSRAASPFRDSARDHDSEGGGTKRRECDGVCSSPSPQMQDSGNVHEKVVGGSSVEGKMSGNLEESLSNPSCAASGELKGLALHQDSGKNKIGETCGVDRPVSEESRVSEPQSLQSSLEQNSSLAEPCSTGLAHHQDEKTNSGLCTDTLRSKECEDGSLEEKRFKRLARIRKLMGDMKEKGLLQPLPSTQDSESHIREAGSSDAPHRAEEENGMNHGQECEVHVHKPSDAEHLPSAATPALLADSANQGGQLTTPDLSVVEPSETIDSLDAYMEVITTEMRELQSTSTHKTVRRRRRKAPQWSASETSQSFPTVSQSITLEEILAFQKSSIDARASCTEKSLLCPSEKESSRDGPPEIHTHAAAHDAHEGVDKSQTLEVLSPSLSFLEHPQDHQSPMESSLCPTSDPQQKAGVDSQQVTGPLDEAIKPKQHQDPNEDVYYEQFIKAIRTHHQEPSLTLPGSPSEGGEPEVEALVNTEQNEAPVKGKYEDLDNPDDEDYRYNILDDASTQSYFDLVQKVGNKKELPVVDHNSIDYPPFEKNIYVQVREITLMKDHEVDALRKLHGGIRVRGKHCPRPILNFYQCGLPNSILKIIEKKEYETPFPIQMQALPALMAGRDVIAIAETGSGKTLAYLLPLIRHVLHQPPLGSNDGPIALVLAPTRELAVQIQREAYRYAKASGLRSTSVYGGTGIGDQLSTLKRGTEIVIGTPGRLIDVLTINSGKILNLRRVTFCVLDEADRMFDMGFEPQITSILRNIRPDRQTAMFSATFPPVIENLARRILHKPVEILVGDKGQTASRIEQYIEIWSNYREKFLRLLQLLGEWHEHGSIIVFVSRQNEADELFAELLKYGYPSFVLHGGQDQADRDFTLQDFKEESKSILVATSVAARGLDVKSVVLVINFVAPDHLEDYVHRIGRTGRAGNIGVAYTFLTPQEGDKAEDLIKALKQSHRPIPPKVQELADEFRAKCNMGLACQHKKKGFGGKGFKFTSTEKSRQQQERQRAKKQMGMNESDNEDDGAYLDSEDLENPMAPMPPATATPRATAPPVTPSSGDDVETASARAKALADLIAKQAPTTTSLLTLPPLVANLAGPTTTLSPPLSTALTNANQSPFSSSSTPSIQTPTPLATPPFVVPPPGLIDGSSNAFATSSTAPSPDQKGKQVAALRTTLQQQLGMNMAPLTSLPPNLIHDNAQRALSTAAAAVAAAAAAGLYLKNGSLSGFPSSTGGIPGLSSLAYIDQATGNAVDEFEINDYPQYARFKIMHKDILHRIADHTAAVLQVKGRYVSPEEKDSALVVGVKRLYIEIIGATPIIVQRAKHEIRTLLEAVSLKQLNVGTNARPSGRYSVI